MEQVGDVREDIRLTNKSDLWSPDKLVTHWGLVINVSHELQNSKFCASRLSSVQSTKLLCRSARISVELSA